jgi:hypothetical protein
MYSGPSDQDLGDKKNSSILAILRKEECSTSDPWLGMLESRPKDIESKMYMKVKSKEQR